MSVRRPDGSLLVSGTVYRGHEVAVYQAPPSAADVFVGAVRNRVFCQIGGDDGPETERFGSVLEAVAAAYALIDRLEADHGEPDA